MAQKALILLAAGFEEVEAVTPIDYLRRAGLEVCIAAIDAGGDRTLTGSHGIAVRADTTLAELTAKAGDLTRLCQALDAVLLPGGLPGAANLAASGEAGALITAMFRAGKLVAAICASPALVLAPLGLLAGKRFTCYPGMEAELTGGIWSEDQVVADGNLITSRGAGTAGAFSAAIIGKLLGEVAGEKIARSVLLQI
ncbi:MAG: DJ-1/PfpI family protein [Treponema sp.]|jgi:4-methyl-5(b-hydroxyethyl)-thiazole monophosphate biosynthesis|nr:DJ-1/PfpI family protein [Treponema sp.]